MKLLDEIELSNDITQIGGLLFENIRLLKDIQFATRLVNEFMRSLNKEPLSKKEVTALLNDYLTEDWELGIKTILLVSEKERFKLNLNIVYIIELLFSYTNEFADASILKRLSCKIEKNSILNIKDVTYTLSSDTSKIDRDYVFAVSLRQTALPLIPDFLDYHSKEYSNNFNTYLSFVLLDQSTILMEKTKQAIKEWMLVDAAHQHISETPQMNWLGTQTQLAELFVELKRKGFIKEIEASKIKKSFTKSNSIQQILKPAISDDLEPTFEHIFTKKYAPKFENIKKK